jgi:preprotein translocase subunit SecF
MAPQFEKFDTEFFSKNSKVQEIEQERTRKKAVRLLTFITGLIIISFTTGLVMGIKFAGGAERKIVDENTYNAVSNISTRLSDIVKDASSSIPKPADKVYPKNEFPFVIMVGKDYDENSFKPVARYLSSKGHTVIVSKTEKNYRLYTGPYKTESDARKTLSEISLYKDDPFPANAQIIRRN